MPFSCHNSVEYWLKLVNEPNIKKVSMKKCHASFKNYEKCKFKYKVIHYISNCHDKEDLYIKVLWKLWL